MPQGGNSVRPGKCEEHICARTVCRKNHRRDIEATPSGSEFPGPASHRVHCQGRATHSSEQPIVAYAAESGARADQTRRPNWYF